MKKAILLSITFFLLNSLNLLGDNNHKNTLQGSNFQTELTLLDKNKEINPLFFELLDLCYVSHDYTLETVIDQTQKLWLRKPNQELWEMDEVNGKIHNNKETIFSVLEKLGFIEKKHPAKKQYAYAIINGATILPVRARIANLKALIEEGYEFEKIILLGGERVLDPDIEPLEKLLDSENGIIEFDEKWVFDGKLPKNEIEMMLLVYNQSNLPKTLRNIPMEYYSAPLIQLENGNFKRPSNKDTIDAWLSTNPAPKSCISFSSQPYASYQHAVFKTNLPSSFELETVTFGSSKETRLSKYLDTAARCLYQENQYFKT